MASSLVVAGAAAAQTIGEHLGPKLAQMEKNYVDKHGGRMDKAIAAALHVGCIVCGAMSHRLDWQASGREGIADLPPACDFHTVDEVQAAKAQADSNAQKAQAEADARRVQSNVNNAAANSAQGPTRPSGVSVATPQVASGQQSSGAAATQPPPPVQATPTGPIPASARPAQSAQSAQGSAQAPGPAASTQAPSGSSATAKASVPAEQVGAKPGETTK